MKLIVKEVFQDKFTGEIYTPGKELNFDDKERVSDLESRGLVVVIPAVETVSVFGKDVDKKTLVDALKSIEVKATMNMKEETLLSTIEALDEETTAKLKDALEG